MNDLTEEQAIKILKDFLKHDDQKMEFYEIKALVKLEMFINEKLDKIIKKLEEKEDDR